MATDTAIAMGVLAALAARVPKSKACRTHPSETSGRGTSGRYRLHHVNIYRASRSATANASLESAKLAIVVSSAIAAAIGFVVLRFWSHEKH